MSNFLYWEFEEVTRSGLSGRVETACSKGLLPRIGLVGSYSRACDWMPALAEIS